MYSKLEVFIGLKSNHFDKYHDIILCNVDKPIHGKIKCKLGLHKKSKKNNDDNDKVVTSKDPYIIYDIIYVNLRTQTLLVNLTVHMHDGMIFKFRHCKRDLLLFRQYDSPEMDELWDVKNKKIFKVFNVALLFNEFLKRYGDVNGEKNPVFIMDDVKTNKKGYKVYAPKDSKIKSLCKYEKRISTDIEVMDDDLSEFEKSIFSEYNEYNKNDDVFIIETQVQYKDNIEKITTEVKIKNTLLLQLVIGMICALLVIKH
jgi:hypothetical protein